VTRPLTWLFKPSYISSKSLFRKLSGLVIYSIISLSISAQPSPYKEASDIDWVSFENLEPPQRALIQGNCCGMYVEPKFPSIEGIPGAANLNANSLEADEGEGVLMQGDISIRQENIYLQADTAEYNAGSGNAALEGNLRVRQPGMLLVGTDGSVENAGEVSTLNNASYLMHEDMIRGTAEIIVYTDADGIVTIDNGVYTRCEPGNNSWVMEGETITLNQETGRGLAKNMTMRLGNLPVFYLPMLSFPINDERATGFLAPIIGSTRNGGLDIQTPYYLNLATHYDATLYPRIMTDRGVMFGAEGRYRGRRSQNLLQVNYMPDDNLFDAEELLLPDPQSPPVADRWQVDIEHQSRINRNWSALVDYSAVSDIDYFQDLGNSGLLTNTRSFLYRQGGLQYRNGDWRFRVQALSYQILDPTIPENRQPYERLPKIDLRGNFDYVISPDLSLEYGIKSQYVHFDRDLDINKLSANQIARGAMVTGQRLTLEPEVSLPWASPGAFITPKLKYSYASYQLDDPTEVYTENPNRGIFTGSLDSGLIFERDLELNTGSFIQTLEPRLYYLYNEYQDQTDIPVFDSTELTFGMNQLFRENRFSGKDRIGDTNQLTLAVTTSFLNSRGKEKASASIGQIQYFKDRRVTINDRIGIDERTNTSAVASEFSYKFNDNWRINSYIEWDTEDNSLEVGNFQFRYQSDINHILNFSYRYRDSNSPYTASGFDRRIKQTDVSAVWPLKTNWGLIGRWNYDHANSRNLETIAGLEYSNCCYTVRVLARKWIDNDSLFYGNVDENNGIFLQFELKGFGSVLGGNVTGILNNGINGYRDREYAR
jgi:LPS-assembly protein